MASVFVRACSGCLTIIRFEHLDHEVTCENCGTKSKLQMGRSDDDRAQLELFVEEDLGPRIRL